MVKPNCGCVKAPKPYGLNRTLTPQRADELFKGNAPPADFRWCKDCRPKDADGRFAAEVVNMAQQRCECGMARATYGLVGGRPTWCKQCPIPAGTPSDQVVDLKNPRCECGRAQPCFAPPGSSRKDARWCATCPGRPADAKDVVSIASQARHGKSKRGTEDPEAEAESP